VRLFNPAVFNGPELFNTGAEDPPPDYPPPGSHRPRRPIKVVLELTPDEERDLMVVLLHRRLGL
jgi:hypothetical protein